MTLSVTHPAEAASPLRGLLPLWVGVFIYALFIVAGNRLLLDPDTMWQITVGQWILDHRMVPETDVYSFTMRGQPWISTQWLAQVIYAKAFSIAGWSGPVVVAASAIAATFALLAKFLTRRLSDSTTLVFVAAALALTVPHLLARPHVLALPLMVAWVGGMIAAADRRGAPSFWLLPVMALWANLHGGFVLGLVLIAPIALDAVLSADAASRKSLLLRWALFAVAAVARVAARPMAGTHCWPRRRSGTRRGAAADQGMAAGGFRQRRPAGNLPAARNRAGAVARHPTAAAAHRAAAGLLHMALAQGRAAEILALLAPLVLAAPLAKQIGGAETHIQASRRCHAASCSPASRCCCWRVHWPLRRCTATSRTPAARRSQPSPR